MVTISCDDCVANMAVVADNLVVVAADSRCFLFAGGFSLHVLL